MNREEARGHPEEDIRPDQIPRWAEELNVTPEELRMAIEQVGPISAEVRKYLAGQRPNAG